MDQLEVNWAEIAECGMVTTIIEVFEVQENVALSLLSGAIGAMVNCLCSLGAGIELLPAA